MQIIKLFILIPFLLFTEYVNDSSDKNRIDWSADRPLTWDDFQAEPHQDYDHIAAITSSLIQYKYYCEHEDLNFQIKAIFNKDESWVQSHAKSYNYLRHEQLHFDITELYSRKLKELIEHSQYKCEDETQAINEIKELILEWRQTQNQYDYQTGYSQNATEQREWERHVKKLLKLYAEYI